MYMVRTEDDTRLEGKHTSPGLRALLWRNGITPTRNAALDVKLAQPLMMMEATHKDSPKATLDKMRNEQIT